MAGQPIHLRVWRGDVTGGELHDYRLNADDGMVVLDAVRAIQATQANDLAVRWNCKAGQCGSCSAEINGMPRLMCMTRVDALPAGAPITVTPMRAFPVIRDLVTDVSANFRKADSIAPFEAVAPDSDGMLRMDPRDVARLREFHRCIECFLCQDVCHVIRDHPDTAAAYGGPRQMVRLAALAMNPLDAIDRIPTVEHDAGIGYCNVTRCCTEVCPERIGITDNAIIALKERVADRFDDPLARLVRRATRHR